MFTVTVAGDETCLASAVERGASSKLVATHLQRPSVLSAPAMRCGPP
jgi:hypothetical protein